jgi:hypothetical protein
MLARLYDHPARRDDELLPWNWSRRAPITGHRVGREITKILRCQWSYPRPSPDAYVERALWQLWTDAVREREMSPETGKCLTYIPCVLEATEKHAGLGGWVGAIGAVLAITVAVVGIFVALSIARSEYRHSRIEEQKRRRAEIDLITNIINAFEALVRRYSGLDQNSQEAKDFVKTHMNDPEWHSTSDLASLPVTQWPNLETYFEFKRYWFDSLQFVKMASINDVDKVEHYARWKGRHDSSIPKLRNLLRTARQSVDDELAGLKGS